jgi:hypothetical protein
MSTRCQIRFQDENGVAQIYCHYDGYPDGENGVIAELKRLRDFLEKAEVFRGADYLASQFIFWQKLNLILRMKNCLGIKAIEELLDPEKSREAMLGHGVEDPNAGIHGDEEYLYIVTLKSQSHWEVKVSKRNGFPRWEEPDIKEAFEKAEWEFEGSLEEAYERYVKEEGP